MHGETHRLTMAQGQRAFAAWNTLLDDMQRPTWTPGDAWWDVGVPEVSARAEVREGPAKQRVGV